MPTVKLQLMTILAFGARAKGELPVGSIRKGGISIRKDEEYKIFCWSQINQIIDTE
jgi:hypothetical protein